MSRSIIGGWIKFDKTGTPSQRKSSAFVVFPPVNTEDRSMQAILPWIGVLAALMSSLSYIPQVQKALPRDSTTDLSLTMLTVLTTGLWLWVCYGLFKGDWIIIIANLVGSALSLTVLICKIRDLRAQG